MYEGCGSCKGDQCKKGAEVISVKMVQGDGEVISVGRIAGGVMQK